MCKKHDDCCSCGEPARRAKPTWCGEVDCTKPGDIFDCEIPDIPCGGYQLEQICCFPKGETDQQQMKFLLNKLNELICLFNKYDKNIYGAYQKLICSTVYNDAYYSEITVDQGFIPATRVGYKVNRIPHLDKCGDPIYIELGLAYNNTTNSGVKEDMFSCSQRTYADKLIPAYQIADAWSGLAMWKRAPLNAPPITPSGLSIPVETKYTLGINDKGFLMVYDNTQPYSVLQHDCVENAMGVQGVLITEGKSSVSMYPDNADQLMSRVGIGQNFSTYERFMVIVDGTDTTGCTSQQLADIFAKYGCSIAVEVANGSSSAMLDKGQFEFMPSTVTTDSVPTVPAINAFWYVTKERHYHNKYTREVSELIQRTGALMWRAIISNRSIDEIKEELIVIKDDLDKEIADRIAGDEHLQEEVDGLDTRVTTLEEEEHQIEIDLAKEREERIAADIALGERIDEADAAIAKETEERKAAIEQEANERKAADEEETKERKAADDELDKRITKEVDDRTASDTTINKRIDDTNVALQQETNDRIAGDTALGNRITQEVSDRTADVSRLEGLIRDITTRVIALEELTASHTASIAELQTQMGILRDDMTAIQALVSQMQKTVDGLIQNFSDLEQEFVGLKKQFADLETLVNSLDPVVSVEVTDTDDTKIYELKTKKGFKLTEPITVPKDSGAGKYVEKAGDTMTGNLSLGTHDINEAGTVTSEHLHTNDGTVQTVSEEDTSMVNVKYVKDAVAGVPIGDYLPLDGSKPMTGDLQMGGHNVTARGISADTLEVMSETVLNGKTSVPTPSKENLEEIANVEYVNKAIEGVPKGDFLPLDGSKAMTGILNMGNQAIRYVADIETDSVTILDSNQNPLFVFMRTTDKDKNDLLSIFALNSKEASPALEINAINRTTSMNLHRLIMVGEPVDDRDAATKAYVDAQLVKGEYLPLNGSKAMTGSLNMGGLSIQNLDYIQITKGAIFVSESDMQLFVMFVGKDSDGKKNLSIATSTDAPFITFNALQKTIDMYNQRLLHVATPVENTDAATKEYVDTEIAKVEPVEGGYLPLNGSKPMTGNLEMGKNAIDGCVGIYGLTSIIFNLTSGNKGTFMLMGNFNAVDDFDTLDLIYNPQESGTMCLSIRPKLGEIDFYNKTLKNVTEPTNDKDAATKNYVDNKTPKKYIDYYNNYIVGETENVTDEVIKLGNPGYSVHYTTITPDGIVNFKETGTYLITLRAAIDGAEGKSFLLSKLTIPTDIMGIELYQTMDLENPNGINSIATGSAVFSITNIDTQQINLLATTGSHRFNVKYWVQISKLTDDSVLEG